jgi:multidrug resistance protein, MATE family
VLAGAVVGVQSNVLAAWLMIFGHWGLPAMGVAGAAWATNIAVGIELAVLAVMAGWTSGRHLGILAWQPRLREMGTLVRVGVPSGGQFVADILAWTLFMSLIMGVYGTKAMAANTFVFRFWQMSFMPAIGLSAAVTALVGRYIGMKRPDVAEARADLGFRVSAVYMLSCGAFFFVMRHRLIGMFTDDPEILRIGAMVLVFAAIYQFFDAMYIIYNGALRGAGDTLVPALAVLVLCWAITVGGGYAVARLHPEWGPGGPWVMATIYGVLLGIFMLVRFKRGRWRSIRLEGSGALDRLPGFEVIAASPDAAYMGNGRSKGTRRDS